jgi:cytolysin-activating lysine-acyltransferase
MYVEKVKLDIIAPGLIEQTWSEAEVMGSAIWLWMHSPMHRELPLHSLNALLLPAIKSKQFMLASEAGKPVFYVAWANFDSDAEQRYLHDTRITMQDADWTSGERGWFLDWIAPFGHNLAMTRLFKEQFFASRCMRFLDHRGSERGLKIKQCHGASLLPAETSEWFATHTVTLPSGKSQTTQAQTNNEMIKDFS